MKPLTKLVFHRIKEEERRKELLKMRDEARAARLAELEVSLSSGPLLRSLTVVLTITIYRTEGWRAFFRGLFPSLLGITHVAVQFPLYEALKRWASAYPSFSMLNLAMTS